MTIERLKELNEKATKGPWKTEAEGRGVFSGSMFDKTNPVKLSFSIMSPNGENDGELIALSRNLLPDLLALYEAANKYYLARMALEDTDEFCAIGQIIEKLQGEGSGDE